MRICALAGGVGSARFLAGLVKVVDPAELTIIVNTGDDERIRGLHVSPDVDTVLYHLAGATDWDRGWGLDAESFVANERYGELVSRADDVGADLQEWFTLGDRDLATHMLRSRLLDAGYMLSAATDVVRRALGVTAQVLPMSDDAVRTVLETTSGERLDFQTYFVRRAHTETIARIAFEGAERARPAPGVIEALEGAELVVIPPSNPLVSVAPILAVPGVRDAVAASRGPRVAVSPIVGGRAIKGPADSLLASLGHEVSAVGVANIYRGIVDVFVIDDADASRAAEIESLGMEVVVCDTIMSGVEEAARLAKMVCDNAGEHPRTPGHAV
jgi:LPPG:FO 2-phospho-L-lactate transferase